MQLSHCVVCMLNSSCNRNRVEATEFPKQRKTLKIKWTCIKLTAAVIKAGINMKTCNIWVKHKYAIHKEMHSAISVEKILNPRSMNARALDVQKWNLITHHILSASGAYQILLLDTVWVNNYNQLSHTHTQDQIKYKWSKFCFQLLVGSKHIWKIVRFMTEKHSKNQKKELINNYYNWNIFLPLCTDKIQGIYFLRTCHYKAYSLHSTHICAKTEHENDLQNPNNFNPLGSQKTINYLDMSLYRALLRSK